MRVVLDANIVISALISSKGYPARIVDAWLRGHLDVLISPPIIDEILRVTAYQRIQKKYPMVKERRLEFVELLSEQGILVEPEERLHVVEEDESDNRYVECAAAGSAQYIVSGDEHLLRVGNYRGIEIITPAAFVAFISTREL